MPSHPPFDLTNRVLYRDGLVLVIDKPAGFAVHPGPGKYENLQASYAQLRFGLPRDPALAHRLDRETSGCLVLGRHAKALRKLGTLFKNNKIEKTYWAVVCGAPPNSQGTLSAPLIQQKVGGSFGYKMMVDDDGQEAITHYVVKQSDKNFSWVELKPITGRTHQLRAHMAHMGCPIVGDTRYGGAAHDAGMLLHARQVVLPLAATKPPIVVKAPLPEHMNHMFDQHQWGDESG